MSDFQLCGWVSDFILSSDCRNNLSRWNILKGAEKTFLILSISKTKCHCSNTFMPEHYELLLPSRCLTSLDVELTQKRLKMQGMYMEWEEKYEIDKILLSWTRCQSDNGKLSTHSWTQFLNLVILDSTQSNKISILFLHWSMKYLNYWLLWFQLDLQYLSQAYFYWFSRYFSGSVVLLRKLQLVSILEHGFGRKCHILNRWDNTYTYLF